MDVFKAKLGKLLVSLLILGGVFIVQALPAWAADPITVKVGTYDNPPKIWMDDDGVAQGFWADLMNAIAEEEGWNIEYVEGNWSEGLERLEANEIDMMLDVALSEPRKLLYDFNEETALINWAIIYTRSGVDIQSVMDLEGKRIAVMKKGIHYSGPLGLKNLLESFKMEAEIIDVGIYADVFKLLDNKEADAGVVNRVFGLMNEKDYNVQRTNVIYNPIELRFALTKGAEKNADLIAHIDNQMFRFKEDSESIYHKSIQRHLSSMVEEVEVFPRWFIYMMLCTLGAILLAIVYFFLQRKIRRQLELMVKERTEEVIKEKEKFQHLFETSNDSLVLMDASSMEIIDCNDTAWKVIGYSKKEDLIGKTPNDFSAPIQQGGKPVEEALQDVLAEVLEEGKALFEWINRRVDGTDINTMIMFTPIQMDGQQIIYASMRDITEHKQAEEKVRALDKLKSRFITALSHVTRTPLNRIRWSLESLGGGEFGEPTDEQRTLIRQALESEFEVLQVMDHIITALDIERGALSIEKTPTSLASLVTSVREGFKKIREHGDIKCEFLLPKKDLPAVDIDASRIRSVITVLIDNARHYLSGDDKQVELRLSQEGENVRFSVKDTGIGIPKAEQAHVFSRFFRASNAATNHPDGVGIGLYIARAIIEAHGGKMGFESKEGKGSTFWFELPIG